MFKPVPQPPVNPSLRALERHDFWPGFVMALGGLVVAFCGAWHLTNVDSVDGGTASETQLIKALSCGGLQFADQMPPPPPPDFKAAANPAEALDRWAGQQAAAQPPAWKIRVNAGAKTPCPT
ncbi:MAG: hypothetical protein ABSG59_04205 [Verrucomicrobiota bacterium]|jgi:hypothetical protein